MWESNYALEPMDLKLLLIRWKQKIWIPIIAALLGAAIGGMLYMVQQVLLAPEPTYETYSELYVDFAADENGAYTYYSFNEAGWNSLVKTDVVLEGARKLLSFPITKEELREAVSANNRSDHRMIQMTVAYQNPEQAVAIANAMEQSLLAFAKELRECENIRLFTSAEHAKRIIVNSYTARAAFLGGLLVLVGTLFVQWLLLVLDDSIYVPITFERRYGLAMLGVLTKKQNEKYKLDLISMKNAMCTSKNGYYVAGIDEEQNREVICKILNEKPLLELEQQPKEIELILAVQAGAHNGKRIEQTISNLKKRGFHIAAAVLVEADDWLLKEYYFGKKEKKA